MDEQEYVSLTDGIPPEELTSVVARGTRSESANGGSGLGLAITADIATAYGATLELDRADIGGLEVTLRFPVASVRRGAAPA